MKKQTVIDRRSSICDRRKALSNGPHDRLTKRSVTYLFSDIFSV